MLAAQGVTVVRAGRKLVNRADLQLHQGELVGLIGPNGAGKSTLLNTLAGLNHADDGTVLLGGKDLASVSVKQRSQTMAWVAQSGPVNWPLSVERIVTLGRRPHLGAWQKLNDADKQAIESALAATDCEALRDQDATTLSGGERTRMMLARALAAQPQILLADEPVAALDLKHQLQTMQVLRSFASGQRCCLVVLHDLSLAARFCDRLYVMHAGSMFADGEPGKVLTDNTLRRVYGVEIDSGEARVPWIVAVRETQPE